MSAHQASRVVVVHSSDEMYGADRVVLYVLDALRTVGVDVEVWLPNDLPHGEFALCERLDVLGVPWQHLSLPILRRARVRPQHLPRLLSDWVRMWWRLRKRPPHAVYLGSSACLPGAAAAWLAGVPSRILHVQERWSGSEARALRLLARMTTMRIAISTGVAEAASLEHPAAVVVANCVEDASTRVEASALGRDPGEELVFVVASRWNRWKGHGTLLRAWDRADCPGHLIILGGPPLTGDGVDVPALVADHVSRPETVEVIGEVADIAPYVAAADVVVLPSDEPEPFGLVVIEAFSLGRPAVASNAGGPAEIVTDGRTGWLFDIEDSAHLGRILGGLRAPDVVDAGRQARACYQEHYLPDRFRRTIGELVAAELARSAASAG